MLEFREKGEIDARTPTPRNSEDSKISPMCKFFVFILEEFPKVRDIKPQTENGQDVTRKPAGDMSGTSATPRG